MVNDEDPCQLKDEEAAQGWQASKVAHHPFFKQHICQLRVNFFVFGAIFFLFSDSFFMLDW